MMRYLSLLTTDGNRGAVARAWSAIPLGTLGNLLFKPRMVHTLSKAPAGFSRAAPNVYVERQPLMM